MTDLSVRRAATADAPVILALLRELAVYEKLLDAFRLDESLVLRDMLGTDAVAHCEIAFVGDRPAGLALWFWTYKSFRASRGVFLEDLYVRPEFRGRGIASALLAELARSCGAAGGTFMEWFVLDWNTTAIDFYRRIGAQTLDDWRICRLDTPAMTKLGAS
jgi:GNAT superfamily N-acetyltransferase